ncbi:replication-relaxation family protein [Metabacillus fastidiosus]|uniref:replication-relaxation family protein n=1 Tax=Metabacillus fastidiosus TaxID=1458 RepID=UPI003D2C720C
MVNVLGYQLSPKMIKTLDFLYTHRAVTIEQITRGLGYKQTYSSYKNLYNLVVKLKDIKLVDSDDIKHSSKHIYYLTKEGHELMTRYKNIPSTKIGMGFNNDLGYFPYDLYKYPQKQTSHFSLIVELSLHVREFNRLPRLKKITNIRSLAQKRRMTNIRSIKPEKNIKRIPSKYKPSQNIHSNALQNKDVHQILFRDNLYASQEFMIQEKNKSIKLHYRPDAEILINNKLYAIEIDRTTERGRVLIDKFIGYRRYFDYLKQNRNPLPLEIVFITEDRDKDYGLNIRWETLTNMFFKILGEYSTKVNLRLITINETKKFLLGETGKGLKQLKGAVDSLAAKNDFIFGDTIRRLIGEVTGDSYIASRDQYHFYYFGKVQGYETINWINALQFKRDIDHYNIKEHGSVIDNIVPVFFYVDDKPQWVGSEILSKNRKMFERSIFFNIRTLNYYQDTFPARKYNNSLDMM